MGKVAKWVISLFIFCSHHKFNLILESIMTSSDSNLLPITIMEDRIVIFDYHFFYFMYYVIYE
jgi:hypothetical protein